MVESGSAIIPVFIDVDPSELQWTRSGDAPYARDLQMLEKKRTSDDKPRYDSTTPERWRNALSLVSNISGFVMDAYNGDEGLLVDAVIEEVWRKVRKTPLHVAKYPTGLDEKLKHLEIMVLLQQQTQKSRVVGIVGLGGVGKSTLAREFLNRHRSNYDRCCFLSNVRETVARSSLSSLQKTLLRDLAHLNHEQINNTDEGIKKLRKHLSSSPSCLIVLDDVDHINQLDALFLPVKDTNQSNCLILVTSRNMDVLTSSGIVEASIYKQTGLNRQHSRQLFCLHAFDQTFPNKGFEQLVEDFLDVCGGLPLSLKLIGALIRGKDLEYWKAQLHKIHRIIPTDIQSKLKSSYDGLDKEEQEIFLDIACFLIGENIHTAIRIWSLDLEGCSSLQRLPDSFGNLANIQNIDLNGCSSLQGLPDWVGQLMGLQSINLAGCSSLQRLPDSVRQLTGLRSLHLEGCSKLQGLPDSVGQLTGLKSLNLEGCSTLQGLPESVGHLTGLRSLHLERCSSLQGLPDSVGQLRGLRSLHLEGCSSLQRLSVSFGDLANLKNIDLNGCSGLQRLPDSVGNVRNLQRIVLRGCSGLHMLPNSFRNLKKLRHVDLSKCSNLEMLPYSFGNLRNLQYIKLSECSNLQMLPSSLENLKHLQYMDLSWCSNLQTLPNSLGNLGNLRYIDLSWCSNLQMLPISFGNLTNLQHINLSGCSNLPILPNSFGNLIQLKHLCLRKCYELTISSETLGQIRTLKWLEISGCYGIEVLPPQITNQRFLREMYLFCPFLKELPSTIGELSHLEILHLESSCLELLEMGELVSLEELQVRECVKLKSIQGLAQLTKLRRLDVANCSGLEKLSGVGHLRSLEKLNASGCPNLQWGWGVLEQLDKQLKGCIIK